ncbi:hypothetical protein OESDEN_09803 [Oesophagostomum dentatum]|uniref:Uncharacterized protein n=1 Tax=Oesophagostomum dentatum TaxID=61180 RepID=A0A0B1T4L8_OESDE|nr:hypothetical protein OESDEN_09803 [Oesophagostomum dentatum]
MNCLLFFAIAGYATAINILGFKQSIAFRRFFCMLTFPFQPCQRKFRVGIPKKFVTRAKTPSKIYEAGSFELANKFQGEGRSCFH